jgi:hypothetical protein
MMGFLLDEFFGVTNRGSYIFTSHIVLLGNFLDAYSSRPNHPEFTRLARACHESPVFHVGFDPIRGRSSHGRVASSVPSSMGVLKFVGQYQKHSSGQQHDEEHPYRKRQGVRACGSDQSRNEVC